MFQPLLNKTPMSTDHILYNAQYVNEYKVPDAPENDGAHIHSFYEVYVNFSGNVSFLVNNRIYPIQKGDIIFTRPEDVHLCLFNGPCYHEHFCLWLDAPNTSPLVSFSHEPDFHNFISPTDKERDDFLQMILTLAHKDSEPLSELTVTTTLFEIMHFLQKHDGSPAPVSSTPLPEEMQQILTYLNNHFDQIQYINEIYDKFFISPATLTRWFRKYIHLSPKEFLESKKLAYAKTLLKNGCTVTEASMQSGFSCTSYFISVFKRKFGMTPLAYKRSPVAGE